MSRKPVGAGILAVFALLFRWEGAAVAMPPARPRASTSLAFEPALPLVSQMYTVSIVSNEDLGDVELGIDRWESAQRLDRPWDNSSREGDPDATHFSGWDWTWDWLVKVSQSGDYAFTLYKDCAADCVAVVQATVTVYSPDDAVMAFNPPRPTVGEEFAVSIEAPAPFANVMLGVDNWQWAERQGRSWSSWGLEDKPSSSEYPEPFGWVMNVSQPGDYTFTFYKDCNDPCTEDCMDSCHTVKQATLTVLPLYTPTPTVEPTADPTDTPVPTQVPTTDPTDAPVPTQAPTVAPTDTPVPTQALTVAPTDTSTPLPTQASILPSPTLLPTHQSPLSTPLVSLPGASRQTPLATSVSTLTPIPDRVAGSQPSAAIVPDPPRTNLHPMAAVAIVAALVGGVGVVVIVARNGWHTEETNVPTRKGRTRIREGTAMRAARAKVLLERRNITQEAACDSVGLSPRRYRDVRDLPEVERLADELREGSIEDWH